MTIKQAGEEFLEEQSDVDEFEDDDPEQEEQSDVGDPEQEESFITRRITGITNWCREHQKLCIMLLGGGVLSGQYAAHEISEAKDISNVKTQITDLHKVLKAEVDATNAGNIGHLITVLESERTTFDSIITELERLEKDVGVRFRSDIVKKALKGIKDGTAATRVADDSRINVLNDVVDILEAIGFEKEASRGKKALIRFANIDIDAIPQLAAELHKYRALLKRLRSVVLRMEDIDLETPTNNLVANFVSKFQSTDDSEHTVVENIVKQKELRNKRLGEVMELFKAFGLFGHIDKLTESDKLKLETLTEDYAKEKADLKENPNQSVVIKPKLEKLTVAVADLLDDPIAISLDESEIRKIQETLIGLNLLPAGHVNGKMDKLTKDSKKALKEKLAAFFVMIDTFYPEGVIAEDPKAKQIQEILVYMGYLDKTDSDGFFGEQSFVRVGVMRDQLGKQFFKESPIFVLKVLAKFI